MNFIDQYLRFSQSLDIENISQVKQNKVWGRRRSEFGYSQVVIVQDVGEYLDYQVLNPLTSHGQQHQEENVTGGMADKLYKWFLDELASLSVGCQHVHDAVVGIHDHHPGQHHRLQEDVVSPEAWHSLVPDTAQHLLDVGMSHEGFLFTFDCQLESLQGLVVPGGPDGLGVTVVQHHFQLVGAAGVVQQ